jgi:hypothetical protein
MIGIILEGCSCLAREENHASNGAIVPVEKATAICLSACDGLSCGTDAAPADGDPNGDSDASPYKNANSHAITVASSASYADGARLSAAANAGAANPPADGDAPAHADSNADLDANADTRFPLPGGRA